MTRVVPNGEKTIEGLFSLSSVLFNLLGGRKHCNVVPGKVNGNRKMPVRLYLISTPVKTLVTIHISPHLAIFNKFQLSRLHVEEM